MDKPYVVFRGKHRMFFHYPLSVVAIARRYYPNDSNVEKAALYHITLDNLCTANPALKAWLEALAKKDAQERAKAKRRKRKRTVAEHSAKGTKRTADPEKEFILFLKKVMEFKALAEDFLK